MLILTRRIGEVLRIGDDIEVVVLQVRGEQVRLGINAPRDLSVHRQEIYERIQRGEPLDDKVPNERAPAASPQVITRRRRFGSPG